MADLENGFNDKFKPSQYGSELSAYENLIKTHGKELPGLIDQLQQGGTTPEARQARVNAAARLDQLSGLGAGSGFHRYFTGGQIYGYR